MTQLTGAKRSERKKIIGDIKANNFKTILQNNAPKNPKSSVYLKEEDVEVKNEQKNPIAQKLNTIPNTSFGSLTLINSNTDDELEIKEELESESDSSCCET